MPQAPSASWRQAHLGVFLAIFGLLAVSITILGYTAFHVIETQRVERIIDQQKSRLEADKALIINALQLDTRINLAGLRSS